MGSYFKNGTHIKSIEMNKNTFIISLSACILVYILGAFMIPLMDIDASQYASISREMLERKSFLQVYDLGKDYLDKPPMLFWTSALSMHFFGVYDWAYRLPSLIFLGLALYSTYQFVALYYNIQIARLATLILAGCQAFFLIAHDVRTDTMLVGWVMLSIYWLGAWSERKGTKYFLLAIFAIAGGMMTKGPIALVVPVLCFAPHWFCKLDWGFFIKPVYIIGIIILAVLLIPMSWGLYQQYDLHPGKIINGRPIQSGLEFYYWTQSFGRYTGENAYKEMGYFTFLLENMFWSFLPWIFVFLWALVSKTIQIFKEGIFRPSTERISYFGFVLTYLVLSRSQAQLPHYIFVVFPLVAIITAVHWDKYLWYNVTISKPIRFFYGFHILIFSLLIILGAALLILPFGKPSVALVVLEILLLLGVVYLFTSKLLLGQKWFQISFVLIIAVNMIMNLHFYPKLLTYQWGNQLVEVIQQKKWDKNKMVLYQIPNSNAFHFYGQKVFTRLEDSTQLKIGDWVITDAVNDSALRTQYPASIQQYASYRYHVTMLSLPFLNPATRTQETTAFEVLELKK